MAKQPEKKGNELFYRDENGEKRDAKLHEAILDNPEADRSNRIWSARWCVRKGIFDAEKAREIYSLNGDLEGIDLEG